MIGGGKVTTSYPKLKYLIDSLEVESEIIDIATNEVGATVATIRTACCGRSQLTNHSDYGAVGDLSSRFLIAQEAMAYQFVKEVRGIAQQPGVYQGVRVFMPQRNQWSCLMLAAVDDGLPFTLLQEETIGALCLEPTGAKVDISLGSSSPQEVMTYKAKIRLGDDEYDAFVAPAEMQVPCVLGGDVIGPAKAKSVKDYYRILDSDLDRAYRSSVRSKNSNVLLIGSFKGEDRAHLEAVRDILFAKGYRGVMIDDFADMSDQTLEEKLIFFASICKFVLCVDVSPAGHYIELAACARCGFITAIVLGIAGRSTTAMVADMAIRNPFMRFFGPGGDDLSSVIEEVVVWASQMSTEKSDKLNKIYGWRS